MHAPQQRSSSQSLVLCCYAAEASADIYRCTHNSAIDITPHQARYDVRPSAKEMHIWGCSVLVADHALKKSENRACAGFYYGFAKSRSLLRWFDDTTDICKHAQGARFFELDPTAKNPSCGQRLLHHLCASSAPPSDLVDTQEFSLDVGDKVHFEAEPIVVQVTLPPVGTSLGITLAFDDDYCLCYLASCDAESLFLQALPTYYRRNIYILTVNDSDPVTVDDTVAALKSCQVLHAMSRIEIGIVKCNSHHRTALEEQRAMFNQVRFAPVTVPDLPIPIEPVACRAVTAGIKPDTPAHLGEMLKSPYKA
jgi:hypothetical protein